MEIQYLTFKQVIELGYTKVYAICYGYTEGRILGHYEPFRNPKTIVFYICPLGGGDGYLNNTTFILRDNEDSLDYYLKDGRVYVDDPDIVCDYDY